MATLGFEGLVIGYEADRPLFPAVSLTLRSPSLIALLGRNGAGKSTLLSTIIGGLSPLRGSVMVDGVGAQGLSSRARAQRFAYLPARIAPHPAMTTAHYIAQGLFPQQGWFSPTSDAQRRRVRDALETLGITRFYDRRLGSLSDGERQKAALAMTIVQDAPVVLLDEPTAYLDVSAKAELVTTLKRIAHSRDKIIIFSTHDLLSALQCADLLLLMVPDLGLATAAPDSPEADRLISALFDTESIAYDPRSRSFISRG